MTFDKREALVWDVASGELRARLPLGEGGEAVDFGADGSTVYTAGWIPNVVRPTMTN